MDHNSKGTGNKTASKWETNHLCHPSHPYFWICGRYLQTISCMSPFLSNLFQPSLSPMGWYPGTVSCQSTQRRTSWMAPSASWWCPSSAGWAFTLTGLHTGKKANSYFRWWKIQRFLSAMSMFIVRESYSWRTLLKVTPTALWSEASVFRWSTSKDFQICSTDWCR